MYWAGDAVLETGNFRQRESESKNKGYKSLHDLGGNENRKNADIGKKDVAGPPK